MNVLVNRQLLTAMWILLLGFFLTNDLYAAGNQGSAPDLTRLSKTREIYLEHCASCHGEDGMPLIPGTPDFAKGERLNKKDTVLLKTIRDGKKVMPPWKDTLNGQQQRDVLSYVRAINGDRVFQEKCSSCHSKAVPPLPKAIPKSKPKLRASKRRWNVCKGSKVEQTISRKQIVDVILLLRMTAH